MAMTITPEELYYGSPVTLTYGGTDVGGTTEPPTVSIEITSVAPDFQNAAGPIVGTSVITDVVVSCSLRVNQMTAEKLAWALPGATETGGVITWEAGRVPSDAYQDLVLVGQGLDGREMTVTIENAFSASSISIPFGKGEFGGIDMDFVGHYEASSPYDVPFSIEFSGSGS
jgi:hypothetical protein